MKGEEVNINNISKTIKEEIQDVKENYQNFRASKSYARSRERFDDTGNVVTSVFRTILKIFVIIFGIILVSIGVFSIIALVTSLFVSSEFIGISPFNHELPNYINLFVSGDTLSWFWVGLALTIGIPLIIACLSWHKTDLPVQIKYPAVACRHWDFG